MNNDFFKKMFVSIAYVLYVSLIIIKNQLHFDIGNYEFIIVAIIGICLKIAMSINEIQNIINNISMDELNQLSDKLMTISEKLSTSRSIPTYNEPYQEISPHTPIVLTPICINESENAKEFLINGCKIKISY